MKKRMLRFVGAIICVSALNSLVLTGCSVNIKISPKAEIIETTPEIRDLMAYSSPDGRFTASIPEGFEVSTGGTEADYWIRIYDPENPVLQVSAMLRAGCLLNDQDTKDFYESRRDEPTYGMFADMIIADSVEDFYSQIGEYGEYARKYGTGYDDFACPDISNLTVIDKYEYENFFSDDAFDSSILHATYEDPTTNTEGEGMLAGSMRVGMNVNVVKLNEMYNIFMISAPKGQYSEYESELTSILGSIEFTDQYFDELRGDRYTYEAMDFSVLNDNFKDAAEKIDNIK